MNFFCIHSSPDTSVSLLEEACKKRGIVFHILKPEGYDYAEQTCSGSGDLLYRVDTGEKARTLERHLINKDITSFHKNYFRALATYHFSPIHQKVGIPMPKNFPLLSADRLLLKKYVEGLGGFPIIIKSLTGSHGVGVMKVDSFSSLFSIADFLLSTKNAFVMKEFIRTRTSARLIVLGKKVIGSIEYTANHRDEFRSNTGEKLNVKEKKFSSEIEETAIRAVEVLDLEFGGVDILVSEENNKHYLAEVNFPCFFPRVQMTTGEDIAGAMVDYLVEKSNRTLKSL